MKKTYDLVAELSISSNEPINATDESVVIEKVLEKLKLLEKEFNLKISVISMVVEEA